MSLYGSGDESGCYRDVAFWEREERKPRGGHDEGYNTPWILLPSVAAEG